MVTIYVRDKELSSFSRQMKIPVNTDISTEIFYYAMKLFCANYFWNKPIRSLGVSVSDFDVTYEQFDFEKTVEIAEYTC